jgi:CPA2 family monovalent cation:H+ antiporter-2
VPTLYGDAANSEVMGHAGLRRASLLVITTPDDAANGIIIASARAAAPDLRIVTRASTNGGIEELSDLGANYVIHPELEGGLQIMRRTLLELGFSLRKVQQYTDAVRTDRYNPVINTAEERQFLHDLLNASDNIGLSWLPVSAESSLKRKTLIDSKLREETGVSVVAISRKGELITNPKPQTILLEGDVVGVIGEDEQIEKAKKALASAPLQIGNDQARKHRAEA